MPAAASSPRGAGGQSLLHWLRRRVPAWRRLAALLQRQHDSRSESYDEVLELVDRFRSLGRDLSLARAVVPDSALCRELEALFVQTHEAVYRRPARIGARLRELFRDDIPLVFRKLRANVVVIVALFVASGIAGWLLVAMNPELASLVASEQMIAGVQRGELWTDDLLNVVPSSLLSLRIMTNNIVVSLFAFGLGAFYGLGTIYIIGLNGIMIGGVFALTAQYGLAGRLFEFVVAHGVVELSVICLAGAAGIQLGEALIRPGLKTRMEAFQEAVSEAGKLLPLVAFFLVGAGIIEGYVSPNPAYGLTERVLIGIASGAVLWLTLAGRPWLSRHRVEAPRQI
ncbi:MAG: stage II sporulation protein M [Gammaproteobacteria bacterium]|nr:stage II sporulation protein M [Gammaproteobacteria bacterium]